MEVELLGTTHWLLIALTCQVSASCFLEGCPSPISFGNNFEAYLPSDSPPFKIFPFRILTPLNILQTTTPCWNLSFYYTFEIPCEHSLSLSAFHWGPDCLSKKNLEVFRNHNSRHSNSCKISPQFQNLHASRWNPTFMPGCMFCVTFNCSSPLSISSSWFMLLSIPANG